jgi:hypothetical protein
MIQMSPLTTRIVNVLFGGILLLSPGKSTNHEGYRAVTRYGDGYIAAGSGGRVDRISESGKIFRSEIYPGADLNCLLSFDQMIIAAGDNGTILISSEGGKFRKVDCGTDKNINSLTLFGGIIIAGTDKGELITGDGGKFTGNIRLSLKGNIVSLSAGESDCYGVTDEGEIIHSADGIKWDILDFNVVYSGFYKPCYFTRVLVTENRVAVAGINNDGSPVLMFSNLGKVWTERILSYSDDQGIIYFLADSPEDIFYDSLEDQFFLACTKGKLMKLPSCSQCNNLAIISNEDLTGISSDGNRLLIVGDSYLVKVVNLK